MRKKPLSAGQRFGRLIALEELTERDRHGAIRWLCRCDCGAEKVVAGVALRNGLTQSCGCLHVESAAALNRRHGQYLSRTYKTWAGMIQRCTNPRKRYYEHYGGRGILVCDRWRNDFESFRADMGECPEGLSLDRIDVNGNYEPSNCRWATRAEQMNNTRTVTRLTVDGATKTLHEWASEKGINPRTLQKRLNSGWSHQNAVTTPVRR